MTAEIAQIDPAGCSGFGRCISASEFRLFSFEARAWKKTAVLRDIKRCNGCGECASRCVIGAVSMVETGRSELRLTPETSLHFVADDSRYLVGITVYQTETTIKKSGARLGQ